MELKLNSGDTITIPDGCRAVIKDKIITVEKEVQEFKNGDFCASNNYGENWVYIYKSNRTYYSSFCHAITVVGSNRIEYKNWCDTLEGKTRLATEEEKQFLIDALHAYGKDWDAENKKIIEYRWQPKDGEDYYVINTLFNVIRCTWSSSGFDFDLLVNRNCFKTEEEAKAKADEIIKILNK